MIAWFTKRVRLTASGHSSFSSLLAPLKKQHLAGLLCQLQLYLDKEALCWQREGATWAQTGGAALVWAETITLTTYVMWAKRRGHSCARRGGVARPGRRGVAAWSITFCMIDNQQKCGAVVAEVQIILSFKHEIWVSLQSNLSYVWKDRPTSPSEMVIPMLLSWSNLLTYVVMRVTAGSCYQPTLKIEPIITSCSCFKKAVIFHHHHWLVSRTDSHVSSSPPTLHMNRVKEVFKAGLYVFRWW